MKSCEKVFCSYDYRFKCFKAQDLKSEEFTQSSALLVFQVKINLQNFYPFFFNFYHFTILKSVFLFFSLLGSNLK